MNKIVQSGLLPGLVLLFSACSVDVSNSDTDSDTSSDLDTDSDTDSDSDSETPAVPNVSDSPSVNITYLLQNFESMTGNAIPPVAPHQVMEGSPGYFYVFQDWDTTLDEIYPSGTDGVVLMDGYEASDAFTFYGNTTSMRIQGTSAGRGVGLGAYFEDGEVMILEVVDTEDGNYDPYCEIHPTLGIPCSPAIKSKVPREFSAWGQEGLVFWARGMGTLNVSLHMPEVIAENLGGTCDEDADKCFDFHGVEVTVDGAWREYTISWDKFKQVGWGKAVPFNKDEFVAVNFTVAVPMDPGSADFEIWLDMIGFYGGEPWPFLENYPGAVDPVNGPQQTE